MLNTIHHGEPGQGTPLLIVHGLFGSARNWGVIAKRLSGDRHVVAVDMRNHGSSAWTETHTYPEMAEDLGEVIASLGGQADVIGHSMGGKASMVLALRNPEMVRRLVVADIAPVSYGHSQMQFVNAMRGLDLSGVTTRSQADQGLRETVPELAVRAFLIQSLDVPARKWRLNLDTLARDMDQVLGFPQVSGQYVGPTLFLSGAASDYVLLDHRPTIKPLFPMAKFVKIPGAGHWLHAEKPKEFEAAVRAFLDAEASAFAQAL
ncbi:MAG: alpha/beta fold hydrolase [Pseudomonadota bacterium]